MGKYLTNIQNIWAISDAYFDIKYTKNTEVKKYYI